MCVCVSTYLILHGTGNLLVDGGIQNTIWSLRKHLSKLNRKQVQYKAIVNKTISKLTSFLNKCSERCNAGTRANHNDWQTAILRKPEVRIAANKHGTALSCRHTILKVSGAHPGARLAQKRIPNDSCTDTHCIQALQNRPCVQ